MRALWITHPESDYLASTLYRGMCQVLGAENVVDYPYKESYHGETAYYEQPHGRGLGCTGPCAWQKPTKSVRRTEVEVKNDHFDFVLLESTRPYAIHALEAIIASGWNTRPPVFVCCGEDYSDLSLLIETGNKFGAKALFKRELLKGVNIPNLYPCPFSSVIPEDWPLYVSMPKRYDACLIVGNTNADRQKYVDALNSVKGKYNVYAGSDTQGVRLDQFAFWEVLSRSKISLSTKGWGNDTLRYWEVPSVKSMLLTQKLDIQLPYPFVDGQTCAEFSDPQEMIRKLEYFLTNEGELQRVTQAGYDHLLAHHTARRRAEYVIEIVGRNLN